MTNTATHRSGRALPASTVSLQTRTPSDRLGTKNWDIKAGAGLPGGGVVKNPPAKAGRNDTASIPELDDPLEEEMATHSSVLAWEIPRIEPEEIPHDRGQGSQRAVHDCTHKYTHT